MATKLFFINSAVDGGYPDTHLGSNMAAISGVAQGWAVNLLRLTPGNSASTIASDSVAGPTAGVETNILFISPPLAAAVTISGTVTMNIWANEGAMTDNAGAQVIISKLDSQLTPATILNSERAVELGTASAVNNWTATPTSTAFKRGDRIMARILFNDAGGTMVASVVNLIATYSGPTAAANGDSWISFTETISFDTVDPTGSTLYLTDTAASDSINPGAAIEKDAWTSRGAGSTNAITNTTAGWTAGIQTTDSAGGTAIEWYSRPLSAFTLGGKTKVNIRALESNASANASLRAEVAITDGDGTNAVVWGAACIAPNNSSGGQPSRLGEIGTGDLAWTAYVTGDDTAVANGKRLRIRIQTDDNSLTPLVTGFTTTVSYNGASAAAAGDTYIVLGQTVTEYVAASSKAFIKMVGQAVGRAASR